MRTAAERTATRRRWHRKLEQAQLAVSSAEGKRDELVRQALADGVGVRGVALAIGIDKGTVSRRYGGRP
jgi:DNA invertase Pin-like site-specific DNA recombinase